MNIFRWGGVLFWRKKHTWHLEKDKNSIDSYNLNKKKIEYNKKVEADKIRLDLTLSEECYEIKHSFLSYNSKVRDKLKNFTY